MLVLPLLTVDVVCKHGDHIFIGVMIEMMNLVTSVEYIGKHFWRRSVDNRRGYHVWYVSMIAIFRYLELRVRVELADGGQVNVATEDSDTDGLFRCQSL